MAQDDAVLEILGSLLGGAMQGSMQSDAVDKQIQANEDITLLKDSLGMGNMRLQDSLNRENALLQDSLSRDAEMSKLQMQDSLANDSYQQNQLFADSLRTKNQSTIDSMKQVMQDDSQAHDMDLQRTRSLLGLIPAQTSLATQGIADDISSLDQKYGAVQAKMALRNQGIADAKSTPIDLEHLRGKKLREFFDESPFMGLNESDIIDSYNDAKTNERQPLDFAINTAIKLPASNPKRQSMVKLVDDMLEKLGVTYNEAGERQTGGIYDDFTDGDFGLGGGTDPQGQSAKAIIEELETYRTMLSGGEKSIDQLYEISPEERELYDSYGVTKGAKKKEIRDLERDVITKLIEQLSK